MSTCRTTSCSGARVYSQGKAHYSGIGGAPPQKMSGSEDEFVVVATEEDEMMQPPGDLKQLVELFNDAISAISVCSGMLKEKNVAEAPVLDLAVADVQKTVAALEKRLSVETSPAMKQLLHVSHQSLRQMWDEKGCLVVENADLKNQLPALKAQLESMKQFCVQIQQIVLGRCDDNVKPPAVIEEVKNAMDRLRQQDRNRELEKSQSDTIIRRLNEKIADLEKQARSTVHVNQIEEDLKQLKYDKLALEKKNELEIARSNGFLKEKDELNALLQVQIREKESALNAATQLRQSLSKSELENQMLQNEKERVTIRANTLSNDKEELQQAYAKLNEQLQEKERKMTKLDSENTDESQQNMKKLTEENRDIKATLFDMTSERERLLKVNTTLLEQLQEKDAAAKLNKERAEHRMLEEKKNIENQQSAYEKQITDLQDKCAQMAKCNEETRTRLSEEKLLLESRIADLMKKLEDMEAKNDTVTRNLQSAEDTKSALEKELMTLRNRVTELEEDYEAEQQKNVDCALVKDKLDKEMLLQKREASKWKHDYLNQTGDLEEAEGRIKTLTDDVEKLRQEAATQQDDQSAEKQRLQEEGKQMQQEYQRLSDELEMYKRRDVERARESADKKSPEEGDVIDRLQTDLDRCKTEAQGKEERLNQELDKLRQENENLKQKSREQPPNDELERYSEQVRNLHRKNKTLSEELQKIMDDFGKLTEEVDEKNTKLTEAIRSLDKANKEIHHLNRVKQEADTEHAKLEETVRQRTGQIANLTAELETLRSAASDKDKIEALHKNEAQKTQNMQREIDTLRLETQQLRTKLKESNDAMEKLQTELDTRSTEVVDARKELETKKVAIESIKKKLGNYRDEVSQLKEELEKRNRELMTRDHHLNSTKIELAQAMEKVTAFKEDAEKAHAEMKKMQEDMCILRGEAKGVKLREKFADTRLAQHPVGGDMGGPQRHGAGGGGDGRLAGNYQDPQQPGHAQPGPRDARDGGQQWYAKFQEQPGRSGGANGGAVGGQGQAPEKPFWFKFQDNSGPQNQPQQQAAKQPQPDPGHPGPGRLKKAWENEVPQCPVCNILFANRIALEDHFPNCIQ